MKRRPIPKKDNLTDEERKVLVEAGKKAAREMFGEKFGTRKDGPKCITTSAKQI